jgi:hypothetical protein
MQVHVEQQDTVPEIVLEQASVAECPTCQQQQPVVRTTRTLISEMYLCPRCRTVFSIAERGAIRRLAHVLQDAAAMETVF